MLRGYVDKVCGVFIIINEIINERVMCSYNKYSVQCIRGVNKGVFI